MSRTASILLQVAGIGVKLHHASTGEPKDANWVFATAMLHFRSTGSGSSAPWAPWPVVSASLAGVFASAKSSCAGLNFMI